MPRIAVHAAAAHVGDDHDAAALEPGEQARAERRLLDRAVGAVAVQDQRIAAVELGALGEDDRRRHLDAVVAGDLDLARLDALRSVEAAGGNKGERARRRAIDRVMARHAGPAAERDDRAVLLGVGVDEPHRAFNRQFDTRELRHAVVRHALEAFHHTVAARDVDAVARRDESGQHAIGLLDHGLRIGQRSVDRQAQQLEARRVVRAAQVQPGSGEADAVDLGAGVVHLGPARGAGQDVLQGGAVQRLLLLDAVMDDREDDVPPTHRNDHRAVAAVERQRIRARPGPNTTRSASGWARRRR